MSVILAFLYIFDFQVIKAISMVSSVTLVAVYLFMSMIASHRLSQSIQKMLYSKYNKFILRYLILTIIISAIVALLHRTFDFTYTRVLIHQLYNLEIGIMLVGYFKGKNITIIEVIIQSFFIQSMIQIASFISPNFLSITDFFRDEGTIARRELSYVGFRGLAISGSAFFGLAVAYAVVFVLVAFYWDKWKKPKLFKTIYVLFLAFGALSAGRTSVLGIILFVLVMIFKRGSSIRKIGFIIAAIVVSMTITLLYRNVFYEYLNNYSAWIRLSRYLTQIFDESASGGLNTRNVSSLNDLIENMYFRLSAKQVLFGDGKYTVNGLYYMNTDVGYMRNILFWGIFGTVFLYFFSIRMLMKNVRNGGAKHLAYIIILMGFVFELKGQVMGFLITYQSLIILICNSVLFNLEEYDN